MRTEIQLAVDGISFTLRNIHRLSCKIHMNACEFLEDDGVALTLTETVKKDRFELARVHVDNQGRVTIINMPKSHFDKTNFGRVIACLITKDYIFTEETKAIIRWKTRESKHTMPAIDALVSSGQI